MKLPRQSCLLLLALTAGLTSILLARQLATATPKDPFDRKVEAVELKDESIFDAIGRLNDSFDFAISIEGILPAEGTVVNPKFRARIENRTITEVLTWLCGLDPRYTWERDGNMVNLFPRAFENDGRYFFNRTLPVLHFQHVRPVGEAAMEVVHQLGDPNENLVLLGFGGSQDFAKPWTAEFHDITVRQALNRIAQQLGPTYGWQIGGTTKTRLIVFHQKLTTPPHYNVPTEK